MRALRGLFIGGRSTCSLGRVGFWLVFGLAVYFWLARPPAEFPASLENALMCLLAYNLGGKAVNKFAERKGGGSADDDEN